MLSILVPYTYADERRDLLWSRVHHHLVNEFPGAQIGTGSAPNKGGPSRFNHPAAINDAASRAHGDVFMICDSDTIPTGDVHDAIAKVASGKSLSQDEASGAFELVMSGSATPAQV